MSPTNLRVPSDKTALFMENLTAWASVSGIDPRLTIVNEVGKTTNTASLIHYQVFVDDSFFEHFPQWAQYIQQ
jgi:hypothetical protein